MTIVYNARPNSDSDDTEGHIRHSLQKLGHAVVDDGDGDIYLFHKQFNPPKEFTGKYVCWYFDKLWRDRDIWMEKILKTAHLVAMTDETWAMANPHENIAIIRQGIGEQLELTGNSGRFKAKIAFTGSIYGERVDWVNKLKKRYNEALQVYNNAFNGDLYDLCASVSIIVAPPYPSDDYYWSNRIYMILGSGGFLIHPRLKGLSTEYIEGEHYAGYTGMDELFYKIDYYLRNHEERMKIQRAGYEITVKKYNFTERCQSLIKEIHRRKIIGNNAS